MKKVLILGGGFAGVQTVFELQKKGSGKIAIGFGGNPNDKSAVHM
jgi:NADH dehydrogenase FAD-containing subunit